MEDVPYYCPTCDLKVRKQARQKKPKTPRRTKAKAKPKKSAKLQQSSEIILSRQQSSESAITPNKEGLKLKISLKNTPDKEKSQKSSKKKLLEKMKSHRNFLRRDHLLKVRVFLIEIEQLLIHVAINSYKQLCT